MVLGVGTFFNSLLGPGVVSGVDKAHVLLEKQNMVVLTAIPKDAVETTHSEEILRKLHAGVAKRF